MAAASDIDAKELEFCIKGLLFSRPTVVKANVLQRECEEELGKVFPFRQLGFSTFVDYLRSIPSVVQLQPHNGFNPDVFPVASRASSHIDQLVSRQRVAPTKRRGVARRSAYGSRPPAARRRPVREVQQLPSVARPNQLSYSNQSRDFGKRANSSSNYTSSSGNGKRGLDVRDLETDMTREYDKRDLTRNGINSAEDLLSRAGAWVERSETKVYPKIGAKSDILDQSRAKNCIPAEEYDFLDDECDDFDDAFDEYYEEETGKDSEEELSKSVIQHFTRSLGLEENCSSARSLPPAKETSALSSKESACDQSLEILNDDSIISSAMINNFRKILAQNPDGIWASQLQKLYYENFRAALDFLDLGYTSAISLASSLPSVFSIHREGSSDWKLYDARYVTQENLDAQQKNGDTLLSENGRYIPRTIIENIKLMLEKNSNGFRSTDLLQSYQETYRKPLNLDILGFNTLEDFLKILQNDITLIKAQNYYILLPKHTVVPYEAVEPERPDESLNIGAEALGVPIPDDVLKLGDEIPLQELPPVQMDPDPDKPLLDLEVRVAEVITPSFFYMSLDSKHQELENMMDDLEKFYNWEEANYHIPLPYIAENLYCACKFYNYWHRAKIIKIKSHTNVEIEYIDYGTPATVASSELRYLPTEFSSLPAQAICAKLIGVKPLNGEKKYSPEVCASFLKLVENKRLVAHVYEVASRVRHKQERMQLEIILYDTENRIQEIVINDYLIENGLASPVSQTESELPFAGNLPENDYIPSLTNGSSMPLPLDELPSSLLGNGSSSLPVSSVNRFRNISPNLKRYVISKYASRSNIYSQLVLNKYTSAKCPAPEENLENGAGETQTSGPSLPVANGQADCPTNGVSNNSGESKKDTSVTLVDTLDTMHILERIKKKKKHELVGQLKACVGAMKSDLVPSEKKSINIVNTLNNSVHINGTSKTSLDGHWGVACSTSESSDRTEALNSVEAVTPNALADSESRVVHTLNGLGIPKNASFENLVHSKLGNGEVNSKVPAVESCQSYSEGIDKRLNSASIETKLVNGNKCCLDEGIDVKAISNKRKPHRLKNLFSIPTPPK